LDPVRPFTDNELAGSEVLVDMGVHAIDTVRYILGNPKPILPGTMALFQLLKADVSSHICAALRR